MNTGLRLTNSPHELKCQCRQRNQTHEMFPDCQPVKQSFSHVCAPNIRIVRLHSIMESA